MASPLAVNALMILIFYSIIQKFWDWNWQELALYDMAEMINYIYSVTNSKLFIVGHSQALGLAYQQLGRYTAAIKSYGRAIELDDKMVFALVESENISLTLGSFRKISSQCVPAQYGLALGLLCLAKDCMNLGAFKWGASLLEVGKDEFGTLLIHLACGFDSEARTALAFVTLSRWRARVLATVYASNKSSSCFLTNANTTTDATVSFRGRTYAVPA
ncbi:hypothetical protein Ahy_B05g078205 [Arachis hypogaea]|uniref:Beta-galactosidase beta-sandwich domain-containing protein n=1 Tax=Arachis hypogaea TaxID=3818 RepID=A0A444Z6J7_ARAHY|nr:hypothetical protein Ahy_B05g078205 [Arachis hypogaea]